MRAWTRFVFTAAATALAATPVVWACSAPGLNDFPGLHDEDFQCRTVCDKKRECLPSLGDARWDACVEECKTAGWTQGMAECIWAGKCEDGFDKVVVNCTVKPDLDDEEEE